MSFAAEVREELARVECPGPAAAASELSAALLSSGGISFRGAGRYSISVTSTDGAVIRRYFRMLKRFWAAGAQIRTLQGDAFGGQARYQLVADAGAAVDLLRTLGLYDDGALFGLRDLPESLPSASDVSRRAFLRGAFLMVGTLSNPEKSYHMEFAVPKAPLAECLAGMLRDYGLTSGVAQRRARNVVYLKRSEDICDALTLMGAGAAVLKLEDMRIRKDMHNRVNRQLNCDSSNIERTMRAAEGQLRDIAYLADEVGLEKLPGLLRELAQARADNPDASLVELGEMLDPPLGKSGVRARLRKIGELADKLRGGEDTGLRG